MLNGATTQWEAVKLFGLPYGHWQMDAHAVSHAPHGQFKVGSIGCAHTANLTLTLSLPLTMYAPPSPYTLSLAITPTCIRLITTHRFAAATTAMLVISSRAARRLRLPRAVGSCTFS